MIFNNTADTKEAKCETQRKMRKYKRLSLQSDGTAEESYSGHGLGLSDQPLQPPLPALPLQLRSDHLPADSVVLVHPVPLWTEESPSHHEQTKVVHVMKGIADIMEHLKTLYDFLTKC